MTEEGRQPILAVDVDGVLNAISGGQPPPGWCDARALGFRIRYNPAHGEQLLALAEETGAELTWCTTWEEKANEHIGPLVGLPELPWVPMAPGRAGMKFGEYRPHGIIKAMALIAYADGRPFCWLDDEADVDEGVLAEGAPCCGIQVNEKDGLQPRHLMRARAWLTTGAIPARGGKLF